MSQILAGETELPYEKLLLVTQLTQCSLHWLITGEGPQHVSEALGFLQDTHLRIVRELAEGREVDVEQLVGDLLTNALIAEGASLHGRYRELDEKERAELRILSELISDGVKLEQPRKKGEE